MNIHTSYGVVTEPGTVRIERLLAGPIERIWSYLTDSEKRSTWLAGGSMELRAGGKLENRFRNSELSRNDDPPPAHKAFARDGARVFLAGRTRAKMEAVASDIRAFGGDADIDIALNAIGVAHVQGTPLAELSFADFELPVAAYTRTNFLTAKAVARHMRGKGVILTLSTPGARLSGTGFLGNGVASAAVEAFSRILAGELGAQGIRVICLRPDAIPEAMPVSHVRSAFEGFARRAGMSVDDMPAARAANGPLLRRFPSLAEIGDFSAFAASDRAGAMTGAIANLSCGTLVD